MGEGGLPVLKEINLSFGEITEAAALVVAQADMEKVDLNVRNQIDAVLKKLLSGSDLSSYCFLSMLLVMMGLLKGEGKVKKVPLVPETVKLWSPAAAPEFIHDVLV
ncbi:hypothetical protein JOQ06_026822, partial [Pogonophryne albipinna]